MNILIGGDLGPIVGNYEAFIEGNAWALVGDAVYELLKGADYRIFNLECPLTDREAPIPKCGPHLRAPAACVNGLRALGLDLVTVANNHILDHGPGGLADTLDALTSAGIASVGCGNSPMEAAKPYILTLEGKKIGIYACVEHEFLVVGEGSPGANPIDLLETPDHIAALKAECDHVIVLYHGGKEHYRYPTPRLQKVCRKLVEKGADLVVCQHSHCIGCEESYLHGRIVYGQGNFLFGKGLKEGARTGLLIRLDGDLVPTYIPLQKDGSAVRLAEGEAAETILKAFWERSREITTPGFLEKGFRELAESNTNDVLTSISGLEGSLFFKVFRKLAGAERTRRYLYRRYRGKIGKKALNRIECEAWQELLTEILK